MSVEGSVDAAVGIGAVGVLGGTGQPTQLQDDRHGKAAKGVFRFHRKTSLIFHFMFRHQVMA